MLAVPLKASQPQENLLPLLSITHWRWVVDPIDFNRLFGNKKHPKKKLQALKLSLKPERLQHPS